MAIASYITAYGRIRLHEFMSDVESWGGKVLYGDTDSAIVTLDIMTVSELRDKWVIADDPEELGSMKSERGYTLNNKEALSYTRFIGGGSKVYLLSDDKFFNKVLRTVSETHEVLLSSDNILITKNPYDFKGLAVLNDD